MADTSIGWTRSDDGTPGKTWNPTAGCSIVSPGCKNCYAMRMAKRLAMMKKKKYVGTTKQQGGRSVWTGKINLSPESLADPLGWKKPCRIFVNSMSDLFHKDIPDSFIDAVMGVIWAAQWHTFQVLTKRPERLSRYFADKEKRIRQIAASAHAMLSEREPEKADIVTVGDIEQDIADGWPLRNLWLGTSVEDQQRADERIPWLLKTPAAVRFLSCEPLLGHIDIPSAIGCGSASEFDATEMRPLGWIIAGGESGPGARPVDVSWIRSIARQCELACIPVFVKQLGAKPYRIIRVLNGERETPIKLKSRKGEDMAEWPEDLRVQQFPKTNVLGL